MSEVALGNLREQIRQMEQRIGNLEFQVRNLQRLLDRRAECDREMSERGA